MTRRACWNKPVGSVALLVLLVALSSCASLPVQNPDAVGKSVARDPYARKQVYDDHRTVTLPPAPTEQAQCDAWLGQAMALKREGIAPSKDTVGEFYHPELMAIGDSLYNGMQSLRINWFLSEWSAPNLVAIRLGLIQERNGDRTGQRSFYSPQYPSWGLSRRRTDKESRCTVNY